MTEERHWPQFTYPALRYLLLSAGEMDFPSETSAPGNAVYVGPMVQRTRDESGRQDDVDAVRRYLRSRDPTKPLVACMMGSILRLPRFLREVIAAADGAAFDLIRATWPPSPTYRSSRYCTRRRRPSATAASPR